MVKISRTLIATITYVTILVILTVATFLPTLLKITIIPGISAKTFLNIYIIYTVVSTIVYIILSGFIGAATVKEEKVEVSSSVTAEVGEEAEPFIELNEIYPPYVYTGIVKRRNKVEYKVIEPHMTEEEIKIRNKIEQLLYEELKIDGMKFPTREEAEKFLRDYIHQTVKKYKWKLEESSLEKIIYYIVRDHVYYGKIDPLMRDENIEDISCNGPNIPVYVYHRFYESIPTNIVFEEDELNDFIIRLAYLSGRHISIDTPIIDATLPDGTRIHLTFGKEVSRKGSTFSIRKFRKEPFTIIDLINLETLNEHIAAYLWFVVEYNASILVAGGTASGKTTFLNAISLFIRPEKKIVSIEDTAELNLPHENWNPMVERTGFGVRGGEAEIRMFELLKAALRQRPDVIIVGEVRGKEAYTMFQAMATGHGGLGSIHAESVKAVINRLTSEPMNIPTALIPTLNLIVLLARLRVGERIIRKVIHIAEPYLDEKTGEIRLNDVFIWDAYSKQYRYTGVSKTLERISMLTGLSMEAIEDDIERRHTIIRWMVKKNIRSFKDVAEIIRRFYINPNEVYQLAQLELLSMEKPK